MDAHNGAVQKTQEKGGDFVKPTPNHLSIADITRIKASMIKVNSKDPSLFRCECGKEYYLLAEGIEIKKISQSTKGGDFMKPSKPKQKPKPKPSKKPFGY